MKKKINVKSKPANSNDVLLAIKQLDDKLSNKIDVVARHSDDNLNNVAKNFDGKLNSLEKRFDKKLDDVVKFLKNEIDSVFDAVIFKTDEKFEAIDQKIDDLTKKVDFLPTKDEYYKSMDKLMGEVQTSRDAQIILNGRTAEHRDLLEDHEERITKLEHLPHAST